MPGTIPFNRPPRIRVALPSGKIEIPAPPSPTTSQGRNWFLMGLPLAGLLIMASAYGMIYKNWLLAIPMLVMSMFSVTTSIVGSIVQNNEREKENRKHEQQYSSILDQKRSELMRLRETQQHIRRDADPDLPTLLSWAQNRAPRLWERRPMDDDFLRIRLGIGMLASGVEIVPPHSDWPAPQLRAAQNIAQEFRFVPGVPITANLKENGPMGIAGSIKFRTDFARSFICKLIAHHSPDEVHLLAVYSQTREHEWHWLKWLPHTYALNSRTKKHYLANNLFSSVSYMLIDLLDELHHRQNSLGTPQPGDQVADSFPWLVLVVEDYELVRGDPAISLLLTESTRLHATAIFLVDQFKDIPTGCCSVVEQKSQGGATYTVAGLGGESLTFEPEGTEVLLAEQMSRRLAPLEVQTVRGESELQTHIRLFTLVDIKSLDQFDATDNWKKNRPSSPQYLRVPIGIRRGGQPMILDLNHTAHGPHGLVAGTTGSGKSELLQTLVVAIALTHHPYDVGFVLVDFKGGGTFADLQRLPHTLGMVTDISGNLTERALIALDAEIDRRKRLFNDVHVVEIAHYQALFWQSKEKNSEDQIEPLPRLVVIIDEFAELVTDYPDFIDGLIRIARTGRSLGVHLILATQSPAGVVKQQIWANAKFRICLRVESRQESQEMLHRPEAANLPRIPGRGYLQVGNDDVFELFHTARVAGRYPTAGDTGPLRHKIVIAEISPLGWETQLFDSSQKRKQEDTPAWPTDIELVVEKLIADAQRDEIQKLSSPWPDPLPDHIALPILLRQESYDGWDGTNWVFSHTVATPEDSMLDASRPPSLPNRPWLEAVLGLVDNPARQSQYPWLLKLNDQDGHLIIIGAPGSGKEAWIRTLILSLAYTHTPDELNFYLLEFGGQQALSVFDGLPHVGRLFTPLDEERILRLFRFLLDSLSERKSRCDQASVDGLVRLREIPGQALPAIVVVITGFAEFRNTSMFTEDISSSLQRLARDGGPYGIHIVLVGDRAGDIPSVFTSIIARRIALRLADDSDYSIVLGTTLKLNKDQKIPAGRGWYGRPPLEFQTASPGYEQDENLQIPELQRIIDSMNQSWKGQRPDRMELCPDFILLEQLAYLSIDQIQPPSSFAVPLGLDIARLRPVYVDFVADGPDWIVVGTPQSGKTTLLLTWILALAESKSPEQVQFVLVTARRNSLRPVEKLPHILNYCRDSESFYKGDAMSKIEAEIQHREQLANNSPSQINNQPRIIIVFDDYNDFAKMTETERDVKSILEKLGRCGKNNLGIHSITTGPLPNLDVSYTGDPLIKQVKGWLSGFVLRVLDPNELNILGVRATAKEIKQMLRGRGYLVHGGSREMLQIATPGDEDNITTQVEKLRQHWSDKGIPSARWQDISGNQ